MAGNVNLLEPGVLTLCGVPGSPYTRKMLAVLRYRHIPYRLILGSQGAPGLPMAKDIPDKFDIYYFENARVDGPHGAGAVGELPLTSPHASIMNAIYNATGVRITHLPARPEKVLAGLKKLAGDGQAVPA